MTDSRRRRPVVLCILDGWGHREDRENNAIAQANTPVWDGLLASRPYALLDASAEAVGLPAGQMGNSEVGHTNIGAGRVVMQDLPRIDAAIAGGELAGNPVLNDFIDTLKTSGGTAHLMGLMSPGGVHAHQDHIAALARIIAGRGVPVAIHAFLDGRDTPPKSAVGYLKAFLEAVKDSPHIRLATLGGRYFAMDRDNRWERVEVAYRCLVDAEGERADDGIAAIEAGYAQDLSDEFQRPTAIGDYAGMADGDGLLMVNFRADRARQILGALSDPGFEPFARKRIVHFAALAGMSDYSEKLSRRLAALFAAEDITDTIGEVVSRAGLRQLRIAETEKYAHVTFFLNGGREREFPGEDRILVPSPKVATYDLQPRMSAEDVTGRLIGAIETGKYDFIAVNYANPDMVGHTGIMAAATEAVETVDRCLGRLLAAVGKAGGAALVTADHGNVESMADAKTGQPHTAHTTHLVPVVLGAGAAKGTVLRDGCLADVAPTLLGLLGLDQPPAMSGHSLIAGKGDALVRAPQHASA
ncbi:MAG: 2,3-bisphosphoglycerate-independent phosphoglycerate mutase [Alphaproteobacteria bacterium]